ncbi:Endogenous retrovirus group K member 9 Pol protein, partial [Spheniscus humboldti]
QGSLGVDLETTVDITLTNTEVCKIPSNANGPLSSKGSKIGGLLLGRSSAGIKGLIVLPGVIDADYTGVIYIMAYTITPPLFVPKGSRIAQILAFESPIMQPQQGRAVRGSGGFGSTGSAVCFTTKLTQRPMEYVTVQQDGLAIRVCAMLDTGADITIRS